MANNYTLRNNVKLTGVSVTGKAVDATGTHRFEPDPTMPNTKGVMRLSAASTVDNNMSPTVAAMQGFAKATASGVADLTKVDIRFVQLVRINYYGVFYAGRKDSDGMIEYKYKGPLSWKWLLDCLTNSTASSALNKPYYNNETTAKQGAQFFPTINDTPSARVELELYNGKTSRRNYLWDFSSDALFLTYLVFVHADGTREPVEGVSWRLEREVELRWKGGNPEIKSFSSTLRNFKSEILKPEHELYKAIVDGTRDVVNIESNKALANMRSNDGRLNFEEMENHFDGFVEDFWTD